MVSSTTTATKNHAQVTRRICFVVFASVFVAFVSVAAGVAQAPTVTTATVALPPELAQPIAAALAPEVITVTTGTTKLEFWWAKALALKDGAKSPGWSEVGDGTLAGALRLTSAWTDIRGYTIRPGVYTLRFALQPQNGDHMGISPNREFLLPAPAADDQTADPLGYDASVALAKKTSRRAHPAAISIDPPAAAAEPLSATTNDLGHQIVVVRVPTSAGAPITFGIVVTGTIEH
jgi:hypothetical protein